MQVRDRQRPTNSLNHEQHQVRKGEKGASEAVKTRTGDSRCRVQVEKGKIGFWVVLFDESCRQCRKKEFQGRPYKSSTCFLLIHVVMLMQNGYIMTLQLINLSTITETSDF
jgi:hypothetical protein